MIKSYLDQQQNIWKEYYNKFLLARNQNTPHYIKKYLKIQEHLKTL